MHKHSFSNALFHLKRTRLRRSTPIIKQEYKICPTEKLDIFYIVPGAGVEPECLATQNFKSCVYTNSTTRALIYCNKQSVLQKEGESTTRSSSIILRPSNSVKRVWSGLGPPSSSGRGPAAFDSPRGLK